MSISVHPFTETELEATDAVIMAAYQIQHSREESLRRYLALQPDGSFVAKHDGAIVGFGGAMDYGSFAYIGLMAVHPDVQQHGIGRLVLEQLLAWLDLRRCPTALLDATPVGAALYEHCGFIDDDHTLVLQRRQSIQLLQHLPQGVSSLSEQDLPAVVAFDTAYFGAERGALLTSYWADDPSRALVLRDASGQMTGYLIAQPATLGPWVTRTAESAERLLKHALTLPFESEPTVLVSAYHHDALRLLRYYGFSEQRGLRHMRKGKRVQRGRHTTLYGQASLGFG